MATSRSKDPYKRASSTSLTKPSKAPQLFPSPGILRSRTNDILIDDPYSSTAPAQLPRHDHVNHVFDSRDRPTKILSSASNRGTPRSSTDFYSLSNNSSDTLASEYVHPDHGRLLQQAVSTGQQNLLVPSKSRQLPETLMMGYSNIAGFFHLDASLIRSSAFDEVKKKGVIGNQGGGGVVRAESSRHQSGLLGSLGWNALRESLGGFLGTSEVSSINEATKTSNAKWIPVLSTPQSLLFVDLRLEPGQKQSYSYNYRLPAGIPPSYRGKAVKFSYNIVVGVQRATQPTGRHTVRQLDFPFKVYPSVNGMAENLETINLLTMFQAAAKPWAIISCYLTSCSTASP